MMQPPAALAPGRAAYLERRRIATRAAILMAARRIFADASYADAKIDDIIRAAGVSRATFYSYFASKLELACAIYDEIAPETAALFARLPGQLRQGKGAVRQWLTDFIGMHLEHRYVTPLIAQLQLFESRFRARILKDTEALIDLVAKSGDPAFARVVGEGDEARRQRMRVRLLFNQAAGVCAGIARGEMPGADADICLDIISSDMLDLWNEGRSGQ